MLCCSSGDVGIKDTSAAETTQTAGRLVLDLDDDILISRGGGAQSG